MASFKCKMCGGSLEIATGTTVIECEYCGTQQTLPKLDDDKRANMYDRANHFRRNNEFDKAMGIYENILNEDNTDAEAYWSLVLCRYGIEYVEDPISHKRIPTVNRAQFTSIFDDDNYKSALQYADSYQRTIYEEEAKAINEIQKGILAISQKEEPFDVFICYKESDNNGRRTPDSVLAQELYYQLKQEGFKVFFARITLEDKLGSAYEPYIFAALNSAKVMVVLGTKPEFFNAVWVKNEWSRYLALIKQGQKKMLIPAYKDMDPYDLPEEFSHLQAQDMSKLGFMQDLIRGIKKIAKSDEPKPATVVKETVVQSANANVNPLLKRVFMFLEDGDFAKADDFCEQVLNQDPETAQAYVGKLMAELKVKTQDELKDCAEPFDNSNNYQKAIRFADEKLKTALVGYIAYINTRNETARLDGIYHQAKHAMGCARNATEYETAANLFKSILNHKDSEILFAKCHENAKRKRAEEIERAEASRKDKIYNAAIALMNHTTGFINRFETAHYEEAIKKFQSISGWRDADKMVILCKETIEKLIAGAEVAKIEKERKAKRNKKIAIITTPIVCAFIAFMIILGTVINLNSNYNTAISLIEEGDVVKAYEILISLDGYKDSQSKAAAIYVQYKKEKIKTAKVGDIVTLGKYEQDNNTSNGKEEVEWLVLEVKDGKALVISKYALDCQKYNTSYTGVTWETCTLRKWLNDNFINSAFTAGEKAMIPMVTVSADKNPNESTNPGNATQDRVFLLSIAEANKYFNSDSARQCEPTKYAVANGVYTSSSYGNCWWWLRSPGSSQRLAAGVNRGGDVYEYGYGVDSGGSAVRPALWIEVE